MFATLVLADLCLLWWCGRRARVAEAVELGEEAVGLCRRLELDLLPHAVMALGWARGLAACGSGEGEVAEALSLAPNDVDLEILGRWIRGEWALRSGRYDEAAETLERTTGLMHASPSGVPPSAPFLWLCALLAAGRNLQRASERAGVERLFVLSIVGTDRVRGGYFGAKVDHERAIQDGCVPAPVAELAAGPIWNVANLRRFIDEWPRRAGRPSRLLARLAATDPKLVGPLSAREEQMLVLAAMGRPASDIAEQLQMSPEALRAAMRRLFDNKIAAAHERDDEKGPQPDAAQDPSTKASSRAS